MHTTKKKRKKEKYPYQTKQQSNRNNHRQWHMRTAKKVLQEQRLQEGNSV
jgi:hypothetical protein